MAIVMDKIWFSRLMMVCAVWMVLYAFGFFLMPFPYGFIFSNLLLPLVASLFLNSLSVVCHYKISHRIAIVILLVLVFYALIFSLEIFASIFEIGLCNSIFETDWLVGLLQVGVVLVLHLVCFLITAFINHQVRSIRRGRT
jgi:hypothetical protein